MAGGGIALIGTTFVPLLAGLFDLTEESEKSMTYKSFKEGQKVIDI